MATENGGGQNGTTETAITTMEIENGDITTQPQLQEQPQCLFTKKDNGSIESHRYYLSRRTVLEMLKDRGYSIPSDEIQLSLDDFRQIHGQSPDVDRLRLTATHATNPSKRVLIQCYILVFFSFENSVSVFLWCWVLQILVVFSGPGIVKVNGVRDIAGQIVNRESLTGLILIVQNQITSQALKAVNLLSFKVEIFQVCFSLLF